jgi:hypothetical protein
VLGAFKRLEEPPPRDSCLEVCRDGCREVCRCSELLCRVKNELLHWREPKLGNMDSDACAVPPPLLSGVLKATGLDVLRKNAAERPWPDCTGGAGLECSGMAAIAVSA